MYKTYVRFLRIHIAISVPSLVEITSGVPELCPDTHTYIFIDIDGKATWIHPEEMSLKMFYCSVEINRHVNLSTYQNTRKM
jgi:hypothetical protein